jgi:MSHA pilin protein MshC
LKSRGFTLIELIAIITIVGIMAVVALPRMNTLSGFDEKGLHDKLKAGLQFARKTAVASRRFVCLSVTNGTGGTVSLRFENTTPENSAGDCGTGTNLNPPAPDKTTGCASNQICAGSLSLSGTSTSFRFDALGRLNPATSVSFSSTGQPNIVIEADTGYVH